MCGEYVPRMLAGEHAKNCEATSAARSRVEPGHFSAVKAMLDESASAASASQDWLTISQAASVPVRVDQSTGKKRLTDSQRFSVISSKFNDASSSCMDMEEVLPASIHGGTTLSPSVGLTVMSPDVRKAIPSPMISQTYFRQKDFGLGLI